MKRTITLFTAICFALTIKSIASSDGGQKVKDKNVKTFIANSHRVTDRAYQEMGKNSAAWKEFSQKHTSWSVDFNQENRMPHRAYGAPIVMPFSGDAKTTAWSFITNELSMFPLPVSEITFRNATANSKYRYVNYKQFHNGLEVLWANVQIKMTLDGRVMLYGLDVYNDIDISTVPVLDAVAATASATALPGITVSGVQVNPELKIVPVPSEHKNIYKLVYEITVNGKDVDGIPVKYYTLVDANKGEILYRQNRVYHADMDVNVSGMLYTTNPYNAATVEPLKYLRFTTGPSNYTDTSGYAGLSILTAVSAQFYLEGRWAQIQTGGITPTFTTTLNPGPNTISFTSHANIKELSAYRAVQEIHDYFKSVATGSVAEAVEDFQIVTNIDVSGTCNAFYNGSLNFYSLGGGCNPTAEVADVVYHEYGHGINNDVYSAFGGNAGNGALQEGYADTWANGLTEDPVLGIGFYSANPAGYVRRYDVNRKVYPQDLIGEVHADGEIIAGSWWDVGLNFGDHQQREALFFLTFAATLDQPNGSEGILFHDILIEALTDDDDDGNLSNGTPHYCQITAAFGIHGITVSGLTTDISHNDILSSAAQTPITVIASITNFPSGGTLNGLYKINGAGSWNSFTMSNTGGSNYSGTIPAQSPGTIIQYYLNLSDNCATPVNVLPMRANDTPDANIPYFILVDFSLLNTEDFENGAPGWTIGSPVDAATTGVWVIDEPIASYLNGTTGMVQTGTDHTQAPGINCAITGNAAAGSGAGSQDIDGGKTTITSSAYNLSTYTNPVFSYWRWYSNDQGATPGTDFWKTYISNDGITYVPIEDTKVADHSWRRDVIRVSDYVSPSGNVYLRFVAEDGNDPSLVEAAVDDVQIWDFVPTAVHEQEYIAYFSVYPNPVKETINIRWNQLKEELISFQLVDQLGRTIFNLAPQNRSAGNQTLSIPAAHFSSGVYFLQVASEHFNFVKKVNVMN